MLRLNQRIPEDVGVACSGGVDSMVVVDFLLNSPKRNRNTLKIFHVNHGTDHGKEAEEFVKEFCEKNSLKLFLYKINSKKPKENSWEEFWRNERYSFLKSFSLDIITAHHLNDCVETWIMSSLRGCGKLIRSKNENIIRPFLTTSKNEFLRWSEKNEIDYIQDQSNFENTHDRNIIRNQMMEIVLKINPGIEKTVRKLLEKNE